DDPTFEETALADAWLKPQEPVIVVAESGTARAYPLQVLIWHEIVNDTFGQRPIVVTFCPLCNTSLVFDRRAAGRARTFGSTRDFRRRPEWRSPPSRALLSVIRSGAFRGRRPSTTRSAAGRSFSCTARGSRRRSTDL